jgi:hypothetical protein
MEKLNVNSGFDKPNSIASKNTHGNLMPESSNAYGDGAMASNTCTSVNSNVEFSTQVLLENSNQSKSESSNRNFPNQRFQNGEVSDYQYRPYRESADHDLQSNRLDQLQEMQSTLNDMRNSLTENHVIRHYERRPKIMPDSYDGNKSWSEYITHFETISEINDWNYSEKSKYLAASLRGEACQVMRFLSSEYRYDYRCLTNALRTRFDPGNRTELFRVQLRNRFRREKESIPQLAQSIRHLTLQAYPQAHGELFDSLCTDYFLDSLNDSDLRFRVFNSKTKSFDETVAMAIELEAFQMAEKQRNKRFVRDIEVDSWSNQTVANVKTANSKSQNNESDMAKQIENLSKSLASLKSEIDKLSQNKLNKITCWNCGENGHFRNKCPYPITDMGNKYAKNQSN